MLRQVREEIRTAGGGAADAALVSALRAVKSLEIPHLEVDEDIEDQVVH